MCDSYTIRISSMGPATTSPRRVFLLLLLVADVEEERTLLVVDEYLPLLPVVDDDDIVANGIVEYALLNVCGSARTYIHRSGRTSWGTNCLQHLRRTRSWLSSINPTECMARRRVFSMSNPM